MSFTQHQCGPWRNTARHGLRQQSARFPGPHQPTPCSIGHFRISPTPNHATAWGILLRATLQKNFRSGAENAEKGGAPDLSHKLLMTNKIRNIEKIFNDKEAGNMPTQKWPPDLENTCAVAAEWVTKAESGMR